MGILSNIFQKIFPSTHPAVVRDASNANTSLETSQDSQQAPSLRSPTSANPSSASGLKMEEVDVERILDSMPSAQQYNWRTSIVDLMKLLGLDSSLQSRTALASELSYQGDTNDSASMNMWLHKQVMNKLAQNGGKVPADLKD